MHSSRTVRRNIEGKSAHFLEMNTDGITKTWRDDCICSDMLAVEHPKKENPFAHVFVNLKCGLVQAAILATFRWKQCDEYQNPIQVRIVLV